MATDHDFKIKNGLQVENGFLLIGKEAFSSSDGYMGIKTSNMSGENDYMMISGTGDNSTYISAKNGASVYIRGGGNASAHQLRIGSSNAQFYGNLQIDGNLTVNGTTLTVDTTNLQVQDNNITLNYSTGDSSSSANGAGITIQDAVNSSTDATILWNSSVNRFDVSHNWLSNGNIESIGYLQHFGYLYSRDNLRVLNAAGTGWHDWATRSNGNFNLSVGTISSGAITSSGNITITKQTPLLTIQTASNSTNPEIRLKSSGVFSNEGFGIHYDNSVGDAHFQTTYTNNNASLKFYTATGGSPGSSNLRFEIGGDGNFDFNGGNFSDVGTIASTGEASVTSGSITLSSGYNLQWGGAYSSGYPAIFANSTQNVIRFAPSGNTTGTVLEIDSGGLDVKVGGYEINGTAVIDSSRNLTNIGTISASGAITSTSGSSSFLQAIVTSGGLRVAGGGTYSDHGNQMYLHADSSGYGRIAVYDLRLMTGSNNSRVESLRIDNSGNVNVSRGALQIGGTTVIDANRQIYAKTGTQVGEDGTYAGYGVIGFGGVTNGYNRMFGRDDTNDGLFLAAATGRNVFVRANGESSDSLLLGKDGSYSSYATVAFGNNSSNGYNRIFAAPNQSDGMYINAATGRGIFFRVNGTGTNAFQIKSDGGLYVGASGGTLVLDQSRNLSNIGTISSGAITSSGDVKLNGSTVKYAAPVYRGSSSSVSNSGYTTLFTVTGSALASTIRMTLAGTANSVVVNLTADITVGHYQDILITSRSGFYTTVTLKVTSDNNEDFAVEATTNSANAVILAIEVFPLNNETVAFASSHSFTGQSHTHTCSYGVATSGSGGNSGDHRTRGRHFISDGSIAAPSLAFENDSDTGLYRVGSDSLGWVVGGSRKFYTNTARAYFQNLSEGVDVPSLRISGTTVIDGSRNLTNIGTISSGAITSSGSFILSGSLQMSGTANSKVHLPRSGWITFYGNSNEHHAIGSRNSSGSEDDDIRINSYGAVILNLDSNNNDTNTNHSSFIIGRHGGASGTVSSELFRVAGESGDVYFSRGSGQTNRYISAPSGTYGSIQINGSGQNGWQGYNIDGRAVFMHNGSTTTGLYNDVNEHWLVKTVHGGQVDLYHAGVSTLQTNSQGINVNQFVQIGDSSSYNSNSGSWGARLNVTDNVHAKIEVGQDADSMLSHWYAHTGHTSIKFGTSSGHDVELQRGGSTRLTLESTGIKASVPIRRNSHHASGFLEGSYNSVGANADKTNPIYTIGSSYNPAETTLSNMYGIGFSKNTASFMTGALDAGDNNGWGLYVAADGDARIFLNGSDGIINSTGQHYANSSLVWNAGNDGSGSGLDADTLDGVQGSSFLRSDADDSTSGYLQAEGFIGSGGALRIANPGGASFATSASSSTGYLKVTLPQSWTSTMLRMTIKCYEYSSGESFDIHCGGYTYTSSSNWIHTFAYITGGNTVNRNFTVRFGHDGSKCAIYIGESTSTWSYFQFAVTDFIAGYNNYNATQWHNGWSCSITTSLGTITSTQTQTQLNKYVDNYLSWHAGNDGAGSGLDADLLDGLNSTSFARVDAAGSYTNYAHIQRFYSNSALDTGASSQSSLEVFNGTAGNDAFMSFHVSGDHALYFGLDGGTNDLAVGGWSKGSNSYKVWHAANDGSGSGLDADLLDGLQLHTGRNNEVNKVVRTDGNGYIQAGWINTTSGANTTQAISRVYASSDGYIRYYTLANFAPQVSPYLTGIASYTGDPGDNMLQYWETSGNTTLNPTTDWYNAIRMGHGDPVTYYGNTIAVKMTGGNEGDLYTRTLINGTQQSWNKHWHANNDGSGSGLDADLLDGQHGSYYYSSANYPPQTNFENSNNNLSSSTGSGANLNNTFITAARSGNFDCWSGSNFPPGTSHVQGIQVRHSTSSHYGWQLASQYNQPGKMYLRHVSNSTFYDWHTMWSSQNDGPGSGLDADTVDGIQAASTLHKLNNSGYYRPDNWIDFRDSGNAGLYWGAGTAAGWHIYPANTSVMYMRSGNSTHCYLDINANGTTRGYVYANNSNEVGFLDNSQNWRLKCTAAGSVYLGGTQQMRINSSSTTGILESTATNMVYRSSGGGGHNFQRSGGTAIANISNIGDFTALGNVTAYGSPSDINLKENIETISNAVEKVQKLDGVTFNYKKDGGRSTGLIAQQLQEVLPEVVYTAEDLDGEEHLAVRYGNTVGLLVEAIKELKQEINELKAQLKEK